MSSDDLILSLSGLLAALALLTRDVAVLRALLLAAAAVAAGWGAWNGDLLLAGWGAALVGLGAFGLGRHLRQRMGVRLEPDLARIHATVFPDLAKREFLNFWNFGEPFDFAKGEHIVAEGEAPEHLMLVLEGEVRIVKGGAEIARLGPDAFVGEMSFLTGRPASADAVAAGSVRLMVWRQRKLHDLDLINPALQARLNRILGRDLADKIARSKPPARSRD